ncbi:hypothetical protein AWV79_35620 [Cupriavidus sp. UYMMa02A]|nr:hypothetical protein AWV79_35620 [Cupriavidus sp. UYMMa02A]
MTALLSLASAYTDYPEAITEFCDKVEDFTQRQVRELIANLKTPQTEAPIEHANGAEALAQPAPSVQPQLDPVHQEAPSVQPLSEGSSASAGGDNDDNQKPESNDGASKVPQERRSRVTGIEVRHDERPARLLLKVPTSPGLAWIKYEDDGHETEITADTIQQVVSVAVE